MKNITLESSRIEEIRESYRPERVRLLFVGESRPVSGKFFYKGNSALTHHTQQAFKDALGISFDSADEFLDYFKASGCYLDDLSLEPVDHLSKAGRKEVLQASIQGLAERLREYQPELVIALLKRINGYVSDAVTLSGIKAKQCAVPFAGFGNQNRYVKELVDILLSQSIEDLLSG